MPTTACCFLQQRMVLVKNSYKENVTIQLVDILARQVTVFGCICWKRRRQGHRLEPTWMYSRRFPEDMPGNSDELAGTE